MRAKALADQIVDLSRDGTIPTPFGVEHFRARFPHFSESHLRTVLANYEKNGYMVRRAKQCPRFERVSEGLYMPLACGGEKVDISRRRDDRQMLSIGGDMSPIGTGANDYARAQKDLARIAKAVAQRHSAQLTLGKSHAKDVERSDWLWEALLLSFSTMGNARGAAGLMRTKENHDRVTFGVLLTLGPVARLRELRATLRTAKVRMPEKKAEWLADAFVRITNMGGVSDLPPIFSPRIMRLSPGFDAPIGPFPVPWSM